jgi:flagellar basal-body rod protein FlgB
VSGGRPRRVAITSEYGQWRERRAGSGLARSVIDTFHRFLSEIDMSGISGINDNGISDSALVAALRRQMTIAVAKQVAAAGNLANVDTPDYKAVEVTFQSALDERLSPPVATHAGHLSGQASSPVQVQEIQGASPRRDGNTVQLDRELLTMGRAGGDFSAAQTALAAKFRLVRYAINEGR